MLRTCVLVVLVACHSDPSRQSDSFATGDQFQATGSTGHSEQESAQLAERARLGAKAARPGGFTARPLAFDESPDQLDTALDLPAGATVTPSGPLQGRKVLRSLGTLVPIQGGSFVLLSSGVAGTNAPEPGSDIGNTGFDDDLVTLTVQLNVPAETTGFTMKYNFMSAEFPDFVGSLFNDTFTVELEQDGATRVFNVASVNSSTFFPASRSRAADSGFDIVALDPSGVDPDARPDGVGDPDAGLTDFQSFSARVTGGKALTMRLTIQDNGDAFLDSAVLIDAIRFFAIETVDPNTGEPNTTLLEADDAQAFPDTHLTRDTALLATRGRPVRGAVADRATEVVLRLKVPGPGQVTFSVPDARHGAVQAIGGGAVAAAVDVDTVTVGRDEIALAVYRVPDNFVAEPGDALLKERTIRISADYTPTPLPNAPAPFSNSTDFVLARPPVVLLRGMWSTPNDWPQSPLATDARFAVTRVDPAADGEYACDSELRVVGADVDPHAMNCTLGNLPQVPPPGADPTNTTKLCGPQPDRQDALNKAVQQALLNTRRLQLAATQVDMVGHGSGGLVAREYINADTGQQILNLKQGFVNRLITVNTPHYGSPIADRMVAKRSPTFDIKRCTALKNDAPIEAGDIDRLTSANARLRRTAVPSHAIVGRNGNTFSRAVASTKLSVKGTVYLGAEVLGGPAKFAIFPTNVTTPLTPSDAFGRNSSGEAMDHDLFADIVSQAGGLGAGAVSYQDIDNAVPDPNSPGTFKNFDQFSSLRSDTTAAKVIQLLNADRRQLVPQPPPGPDLPLFEEFPDAPHANDPPGLVAERVSEQSPAPAPRPLAVVRDGIRIVSPLTGTVVHAGDVVTVEVEIDEGFRAQAVAAVADQGIEITELAPFRTLLTVPRTALGAVQLFVLGFDDNGDMVSSENVLLIVRTDAVVQRVQILTQDPILFGTGAQRQLLVRGVYSDGVTRDITAAARGTIYRSSNRAVVTVGPNGLLTATGTGIATVAAQNGATQDSITVTVRGNGRPVASAGDDVSLACVAPGSTVPVALDGSASFDPDGDLLTFAWKEGAITLATGPRPTIELGAGEHPIALFASDALQSSAADIVNVSILEDTVPPVITVLGDNPRTLECRGPFSDDGATAIDACDGDVSAALTVTSNVDAAAPGSYSVDYQVRDEAGQTARASRVVQVVDTVPPRIACPPDQLIQTTAATGILSFATEQSDTCGVASVTCALPSGSATPLGPSSDTCTVTDVGGNQASCSFGIFTNAQPTPVCRDITVNADSLCRGAGSVDGGSFDRNGDLAACVQNPAGPYALGVDPVTLACSDTHGGSAQCSASVTVVDRAPPVITCPADGVVECTAGGGVATGVSNATDNCSLASQRCTPASGARVPLGTTQGTCTASDGSGNAASCGFRITVRDTIAPAVATRSEPEVLFPPDHRYRRFRLSDCVTSVTDRCAGRLDINAVGRITRVTSDEPEDRSRFGIGDGDTCNDIVITSATTANLRAERDAFEDGRVYRVFFDVTDASGNTASSSCKVIVPRHSPHEPVRDDGCAYCVGQGCGSCPGHNPHCR